MKEIKIKSTLKENDLYSILKNVQVVLVDKGYVDSNSETVKDIDGEDGNYSVTLILEKVDSKLPAILKQVGSPFNGTKYFDEQEEVEESEETKTEEVKLDEDGNPIVEETKTEEHFSYQTLLFSDEELEEKKNDEGKGNEPAQSFSIVKSKENGTYQCLSSNDLIGDIADKFELIEGNLTSLEAARKLASIVGEHHETKEEHFSFDPKTLLFSDDELNPSPSTLLFSDEGSNSNLSTLLFSDEELNSNPEVEEVTDETKIDPTIELDENGLPKSSVTENFDETKNEEVKLDEDGNPIVDETKTEEVKVEETKTEEVKLDEDGNPVVEETKTEEVKVDDTNNEEVKVIEQSNDVIPDEEEFNATKLQDLKGENFDDETEDLSNEDLFKSESDETTSDLFKKEQVMDDQVDDSEKTTEQLLKEEMNSQVESQGETIASISKKKSETFCVK